jgi:type II secretory pathway pseudopilin PulG
MSVNYSDIQPQRQTRNGLAVASLVLGIISIPTLGVLGVGAITAIVLGSIALNRIKKEPAIHSGKGMAIAGIITGSVSLLLIAVVGIMAAVTAPLLLKGHQANRESAAIQTLRIIHNSQAQFQAIKQKFGTLKELSEAGLIDPNYANGSPVSGYIYTSAEVTEDRYCVQATRQSTSTASRDFNVIEDGAIRYVESKTPSPIPHGEGAPVAGFRSPAQ